MLEEPIKLFTGTANQPLAKKISEHLNIPLGKADVGRFRDGEIAVEIQENVRGQMVCLIQSTCVPTNDSLMELVLMADALRRASARKIVAVVPYFGYARQDRRVRSARVPISAKVVAEMMMAVGIHRLLTVDLHADQIQGFFSIPVDNAYATPMIVDDISQQDFNKTKVVSPDIGGVVRARAVAKRLDDSDLAIIDKRRPTPNEAKVMHIIGEIKDHDCIIVDDIVDTAGTLCEASNALIEQGAKSVTAYVTHPVLSGKAIENLESSAIKELVVTDTIPLSKASQQCKKIRQISLSDMLAQAIQRTAGSGSLSSMFVDK